MTCCRASGENLYTTLGLEKDCTQEDIKKAYRRVRTVSVCKREMCIVAVSLTLNDRAENPMMRYV